MGNIIIKLLYYSSVFNIVLKIKIEITFFLIVFYRI